MARSRPSSSCATSPPLSGATRARASPIRTCSCSAPSVARTHAASRGDAARPCRHARTTVVACVGAGGARLLSPSRFAPLPVRQGRCMRAPRDHTLVQQLVDEGKLQEDAVGSPRSAIGPPVPRCRQTPRVSLRPTAPGARRHPAALLGRLWWPLTRRQLSTGGRYAPTPRSRACTLAESAADRLRQISRWRSPGRGCGAPARGPRTVPLAEVSTEVQDFGATDPDFLRMTDEDIERAIAEIKEALKRQHPPR